MKNPLFNFIREIYSHKFSNGKDIIELTTYENISLWWTVDVLFFQFITNKLKNKSEFDRLNENKILVLILRNRQYFLKFYRIFGLYIELFYDLILFLIIKIFNYIFNQKSDKPNGKKIFFISQDRQWGHVRDFEKGGYKKTDMFFDLISSFLKKKYNVMGVYPIDLYPIRGLKIFIDKIRNWTTLYQPLNNYWSFDSWQKQRKIAWEFYHIFNVIKKDVSFKKICIYNGYDLYDDIISEFEMYFTFFLPHIVKYLEVSRNMIKKENVDLIILINENFWWERSLLIATKLENINSIAIQHGEINPYHRGYMYFKDELSNEDNKYECPIPNKTIVYGPYYHKLLTNTSSYPVESVCALGQPRYDNLILFNEIYLKENYIRAYGIPSQNRVILWTTQNHALIESELKQNIESICNAVKMIDNVTLIVKEHPLDTEVNRKMLEDISEKMNVDMKIVPKNSDTFEHISNCDLLITKDSTTAFEAIILDKPVIILNLSNELDKVDYVTNNVALGVYRGKDLKDAIDVLFDEDVLKNFRKNFLNEHLYKADGKSSLRISQVVDEIFRS